jgi:hypothetical protein
MIINAVFDSSTTGAPAGFFTAVNAAVAYWEREIVNPITVTIQFGYNQVDGQTIGMGALAESESQGISATYAQVEAGLGSAATTANDQIAVAHLPLTDPTSGNGYFVPLAEAEVLGLFGTSSTLVGYAGLSSAFPFTFDPNNRSASGDFDAIGAMEHEISEVLGRIAGSGTLESGTPFYAPLDLFRYVSTGVLATTPAAASFSIDGTHMLLPFNNPAGGNDAGDWDATVHGDSFGEGSQGHAGRVSATDLEVMDALGFTLALPAASDFNSDGASDVLWRNSNGDVDLWLSSNGTTGFTSEDLGVVATSWNVQDVGDFNGDGGSDVLWRNANGDVDLWLSNTSGGFTANDLGVVATSWSVRAVADFNGDGASDVVWQNANGDVDLWLSNGATSFTGFTNHDLGVVPSSWSIQGASDFSGDGKADVLWRNANGDVDVWLSTGGAGFSGVTSTDLGIVASSWSIQGVGDFNGDGKADVLWRNSNGDVDIWLSKSGSGFTGFTSTDLGVVASNWTIQDVGDINGDGKADVVWRGANGDVLAWQSDTGLGFTGFTAHDYGVVGTSWSITESH